MTFPHSSKLAGLKDYISQHEVRFSLSSRWASPPGEVDLPPGRSTFHNWSRWAGQKIRRNTADVTTIDEVHLCPGWATTRLQPHPGELERTTDVVFHVSGFATSRRTPEFLTRPQRAFLRLARTFASLPKPQPIIQPPDTQGLPDFPGSLHLPPRPDEISDDYELENLDAHFRNSSHHGQEMDDNHYAPQFHADTIPTELARLNENMESRLKLFWASSLPSRRIQLSVFLHLLDPRPNWSPRDFQPLLTQEMLTGTDGHFSGTFKIDWNEICTHPVGAHIIPNQTHVEHELLVEAQLINTEHTPELHETPMTIMHIPITRSTLRVISDIDDTVKVSRVLDGARAAFNQVFVKDLEDTVIPEMGEWYSAMWRRGVRFHYVSNSPFELLPVINEFIGISKLPAGSVRLRSYTGRSLFEGLLAAPAARKRGNVVEVLDQFPDSQFLLVGDSGEQDLELYSALAAERPGQIAGVFIRDVSAVGLEDPTGLKIDCGLTNSPRKPKSKTTMSLPNSSAPLRVVPKRAASDTEVAPAHSGAIRIPRPTKTESLLSISHSPESLPDPRFLSRVSEESSSSIASTGTSRSSSMRSARLMWPITEEEKKRWDLQNRVNKARSLMPPHVALRVFEDPQECVEAGQIIRQLMNVN